MGSRMEEDAEFARAYSKIDGAFKSLTKVLLGGEVGELGDFRGYLEGFGTRNSKRESFLGGGEVNLACTHYPADARFITHGEVGEYGKRILGEPFEIDNLKDIDSLFGEARERIAYCGNKHLGNTQFTYGSDTVFDSAYVLDSKEILNCEYVAYSDNARHGKYKFGCSYEAESSFVMRCVACGWNTRALEGHIIFYCSDVYFVFQMENCSDCMFSFNQKSKRHMIGNIELGKEKYLELKGKLLSEVREELARKKTFPSLFELCGGGK